MMIKILKEDDFEIKKERHNELMETNGDYRNTTEMILFSKGKKLELCIEITDEYLSQNIMKLLYDKIEGSDLLGFKVNEVVIYPEGKAQEEVKRVLGEVAANIKQYY